MDLEEEPVKKAEKEWSERPVLMQRTSVSGSQRRLGRKGDGDVKCRGAQTAKSLLAESKRVGFLWLAAWSLFLGTCVPQTIKGCLEGEEGQSVFQRILDKVKNESLEVQTVVSLLRMYQDSNPTVKTALLDRKPEDVEAVQPKGRRNHIPPSRTVLFWEDAVTFVPVIHFFSGLVIVKWFSGKFCLWFQRLHVK